MTIMQTIISTKVEKSVQDATINFYNPKFRIFCNRI